MTSQIAAAHDCFLIELHDAEGAPQRVYLSDMQSPTKDAHDAFRLPSRESAQERCDQANRATKMAGMSWRPTEHVFIP